MQTPGYEGSQLEWTAVGGIIRVAVGVGVGSGGVGTSVGVPVG